MATMYHFADANLQPAVSGHVNCPVSRSSQLQFTRGPALVLHDQLTSLTPIIPDKWPDMNGIALPFMSHPSMQFHVLVGQCFANNIV